MKKLLTTALIPLFFSGFVFAAEAPVAADTTGSKSPAAATDKMAEHGDKMKAKHGKTKHKKDSSMHDDAAIKSGK